MQKTSYFVYYITQLSKMQKFESQKPKKSNPSRALFLFCFAYKRGAGKFLQRIHGAFVFKKAKQKNA